MKSADLDLTDSQKEQKCIKLCRMQMREEDLANSQMYSTHPSMG